MVPRNRHFLIFAGLAIVIACFSCKKENKSYTSRVTILNAVPNISNFRVEIADMVLDSTIAYGMPEFELTAPAATATVAWKSKQPGNFDSSFMTDLPNGDDFTLLFYDSLGRYKSYFTRDAWKQPASNKQGYIRFFPMVINATQLRITNDTNKTLIGPLSFASFANSGATFTAIDTFKTKLRLYNQTSLLDSIPDFILLPGKSYTIYAIGVLKATGDKRPRMIMHQHE